MKKTKREQQVLSSFRQMNDTIPSMENDEICAFISCLFINLAKRNPDQQNIFETIRNISEEMLKD